MDSPINTPRTQPEIELLRAELEELRHEVQQHRREAEAPAPARVRARRRHSVASAWSSREVLWHLGTFMAAGAATSMALVLALGLFEKI